MLPVTRYSLPEREQGRDMQYPKLTAQAYTDLSPEDLRAAVEGLPQLGAKSEPTVAREASR